VSPSGIAHHLLGHRACALPHGLKRTPFVLASVAELILLERTCCLPHRPFGFMELPQAVIVLGCWLAGQQLLKLALNIILLLFEPGGIGCLAPAAALTGLALPFRLRAVPPPGRGGALAVFIALLGTEGPVEKLLLLAHDIGQALKPLEPLG